MTDMENKPHVCRAGWAPGQVIAAAVISATNKTISASERNWDGAYDGRPSRWRRDEVLGYFPNYAAARAAIERAETAFTAHEAEVTEAKNTVREALRRQSRAWRDVFLDAKRPVHGSLA